MAGTLANVNTSFSENVGPYIQNEYVAGGLTLLLILYASMAAPPLADYLRNLFGNFIFQLIFFFLVVLVIAKQSLVVSIIVAIVVMIIIILFNGLRVERMGNLRYKGCPCQQQDDSMMGFDGTMNGTMMNGYMNENQLQFDVDQLLNDSKLYMQNMRYGEEMPNGEDMPTCEEMPMGEEMLAEEVANLENESVRRRRMRRKQMAKQMVDSKVAVAKTKIAEEVMRRSDNLAGMRGRPVSQVDLKQICEDVVSEYSSMSKKSNGMTKMNFVSGIDESLTSYAQVQ